MASFPWELRASRHFGDVWIPLVRLPLRRSDGRIRLVDLVVDTGAVVSVLDRSVGAVMGLNVESGRPVDTRSVGGGTLRAFMHTLPVEIDHRDLRVPFAIADSEDAPNLLGRYGVIDRVDIRLDRRRKTTSIGWRL